MCCSGQTPLFEVYLHSDSVGGDLPSYLEEDPVESPHKSDHAVARPNSSRGIASIAGSWFGNVLNAVNKNLYW